MNTPFPLTPSPKAVPRADYVPDPNQFHPTPLECTVAFYEAERSFMPKKLWEPACGDGAIASYLVDHGHKVLATDLVDRGYGRGGIDFLMEYKGPKAIITNPPFKLAEAFVKHALFDIDVDYLAIFLPAIWPHTDKRRSIYARRPPAREYKLGWRPDMFGIGTPDQRCCYTWTVWDRHAQSQEISILRRPIQHA